MIINPSYQAPKSYNNQVFRPAMRFRETGFDSVSFKGIAPVLKRETVLSAESVAEAYKSIMEILSRKTEKGIENIEKEFADFSFGRGLTFHNCGDKQASIAIRVPDGKTGRDFLKIVVKQGRSFFKERNVLESFTLNGYNKLLKDDNPNSVFVFPKEIVQAAHDAQRETVFQKVLEDLDFSMLKFRKYLEKVKDKDLRAKIFELKTSDIKNLSEISEFYSKADSLLRELPHKQALKLKYEYGDYKIQPRQADYILQNIGEEKCQIYYKTLQNNDEGILTRLVIYDKNGEIADGFLIKDGKYLVSNFNKNNFSIIPPKLTFYDENSVREVVPGFCRYLELYKQKLGDFNEFLSNKIVQKNMPDEILPDEKLLKNFDKICKIYSDLTEKFISYNPAKVSKLKNSYQNWNKDNFQRGFGFKTGCNESVSILKMKGGESDNILRICSSQNGENKYFLINNGRLVQNFNQKYPSLLPEIFKYCSEEEISNSGVYAVLQKALSAIEDFKVYAETPKTVVPPVPKQVKKTDAAPKTSAPKTTKLSRTKDYMDLMKECKTKFGEAMLNAEDNLENFNKTMAEIQRKINEFFQKSDN